MDLFGSSFVVPNARSPLRLARVSASTLSARATPRPRYSRAVPVIQVHPSLSLLLPVVVNPAI
jgi:hypothetical protein